MTALPSELAYGYVTGRFVLAAGDGPDADTLPDARPATSLTVTFTPAQLLHRVGTPATTVLRAATPCKVGDDGYIHETAEGAPPGVWLVTGVYRVTFGGLQSHATPAAFDIEVTDAHTDVAPLDLTTAAPVVPTPASPVNALEVTGSPVSGYVVGVDVDGSLVYMPMSGGGGTGGTTDHGALTGLGDDDHPQYALADGTRGSFAATVHSHEISGVTGLQGALDGKAATVHTHTASDVTSTGASAGEVLTADGSGGAAWAAPSGGGGGASSTPFCHLRPDGTQTLEGVSEVLWQTTVEDASGMHGPTNLGRITAPTAGVYLISGVVSFRGNGTGAARSVQVRKNGSNVTDVTTNTRNGESSSDPTGMPFTVTLRLAAGDYVQIYVWIPSGATGTPSPTTSVLTVAKIGA